MSQSLNSCFSPEYLKIMNDALVDQLSAGVVYRRCKYDLWFVDSTLPPFLWLCDELSETTLNAQKEGKVGLVHNLSDSIISFRCNNYTRVFK